jgi:HAD superfamily hydrolase (TIGR01450 family)
VQVILDPRAVLLDVDGCLLLSDRPGGVGGYLLPGAAALVERLRETGRRYLLFTNASSRTPGDYAATWRDLGLPVSEAQVVTPAVVAAGYLADRGLPVLAFGGSGVEEPLRTCGVELLELQDHPRAGAVLVGSDREFGQQKLEAACRAVAGGAELLVTSDSRWFAGRDSPQVGIAGAIAAGISYVTGVEARVMGKPSPLAMDEVFKRLAVPAADLLVVGDDPALEVAMGKLAGCATALVLTGMTDREAADRLPPELTPDLVAEGVWELADLLAVPLL